LNRRAVIVSLLAGLVTAAASWVIASRPDGRMHVSVLNTGSSPAILIRTGDGSSVLVDGGSSPTLLLAALGRLLPPATAHLDMVVVTGASRLRRTASVDSRATIRSARS
jgi:beta-lactamase superfamily II metal-dependent hydrolase